MTQNVLVIGGNFAGLTAAIELKRELGEDAEITVLSKESRFVFYPSLIWLPFGKRTSGDISVPIRRMLESRGIHFVHAEARKIDPSTRTVDSSVGSHDYDYLVVATGYVNDFDVVPGLGPGGNAFAITALDSAVDAAEGWARFVNKPGPVVVAATQGAACFGAAYEFAFNMAYQLKRHGLRNRAPLSYITAEPFPGHFGIGGLAGGERMLELFFRMTGVRTIFDVAIDEVLPGEMRLADGRTYPFRYAMVVPPFLGAEVVRASGLGNPRGFIDVKDTYQTLDHPNVYAVGIAAAVNAPWNLANAVGVPKTGFPSETMARVAATNIASQIRGEEPTKEENFAEIPALCIMDAGNNGAAIVADRMLPPRRWGAIIPGPQNHLGKVAFERYFLWKVRNGYMHLP